MNKLIDRNDLQRKLSSANPPALVEALPEKYYGDWHLPGAINLPHTEVRARAATLLPDKSRPVVVYCASATCNNSHVAAGILSQVGYADVSVYAGGKQDWSEAELPVERTSVARESATA